MDELGSLVMADQRLAVHQDAGVALVLRSLVAYAAAIEIELVLRRRDVADGASWQDAFYIDEPDRFRIGFTYGNTPPKLHRVMDQGSDEPMITTKHLSGGSGPDGISYLIRLMLEPYPTNGLITVAWSWIAAGLTAGSTNIAVPSQPQHVSIWDE